MTGFIWWSLLAMGATFTVAPVVLGLLRRGGLLDHPSPRSSHSEPVPRGGGLAPAIGALVALAVAAPLPEGHRWALALGAAVFGLIGLVEDVVGIPALRRLCLQIVAAALVSLALLDLGHVSAPLLGRGVLFLGAVFWIVGCVNAFNFMDGVDGISIAQALGAGVTWLVVGTHGGSPAMAAGGAIVAGAAIGFGPWNLPHARMFLGDVGSYFIGAWLAVVAVVGLRDGVPPEAVLAPLVVYLADTGTTLVRRVVNGERWYLPHRDHAYQRLGDAGWSHVRTSAFVAACIGACGALGVVSLGPSVAARIAADSAIAGIVGAYMLSPRWISRGVQTMAVAGLEHGQK